MDGINALLATILLSTIAATADAQTACVQQQLRFEHLSVEDGLSNNWVRTIYQDATGFLWFGTGDGLNRYDGYGFKTYRHVQGDSTALVGNIVNDITEGADGRLWITTTRGVSALDPVAQQFTSYVLDPGSTETAAGPPARGIAVDDSGLVWIATRGSGVAELDPRSGSITYHRHELANNQSLAGDTVNTLYQDNNGTLWVASAGKGLSQLDRATRSFTHYRHHPEDPQSLASNYVRSIRQDAAGNLIVGLWRGGVARMDYRLPGRFEQLLPGADGAGRVRSDDTRIAIADRAGTLWVSNFIPSVARVSFEGGAARTTRIEHHPSDPYSLGDNDVTDIFEDRTGALWFGTLRQGVSRLNRSASALCHVRHDARDPTSIAANKITALLADEGGTIWVGTWGGGLSRYDSASRSFVHYQHDPNDPRSLPDDRVLSVHKTDDGALWVSTWAGGLSRFDAANDNFDNFDSFDTFVGRSATARDLSGESINVIRASGSTDFFWLGSSSGVGKLFQSEMRYESLEAEFDGRRNVVALLEDRSGALWVAFDDGSLMVRDPDGGRARHYGDEGNAYDGASIVGARTIALYEDSSGRIWAGTRNGLFRLNGEVGNRRRYSVRDGLPNRVVNSIIEDAHGLLWLGTHGGLARLDPATETFRNFGLSDGLQGLRFGQTSYRDESGLLYFGGNNGFNMFVPDAVVDDEPIPLNVVFTELTIPGQAGSADSPAAEIDISARSDVTLPYRHSGVTLTYAALGPVPPDGIRYSYRLANVDDGWIDHGSRNRLALAGLSPGTHEVQVRATTNSGRWLADEAAISLVIRPPWWQSRWAFAAYFLIGSALFIAARRYELNRMRLKERLRLEHATTQKLRELDDAKNRFLANLSHEFRTPLTLIVGPLQQLLAEGKDPRHGMILRNAQRLQRLINQILQLSLLEEGEETLDAEVGDLSAFARTVVQEMTPLAVRESVTLSLRADEAVFASFDREHMERVLGNLLSNALKFTPPAGRVTVTVSRDGNEAVVSVADTGVGIPEHLLPRVFDRFFQVDASSRRRYEGTGIGLALVKELVSLHGGTVSVESQVDQGSTFAFRLPLQDASRGHWSELEQPAFADVAQRPIGVPVGTQDADLTRVLIVDDHADMRTFVRSLLNDTYAVHEARDGAEGLELARTILPDVIVADVMMPHLDGFELIREVRSDALLGGVPVILLTALANPQDEVTGFDVGADQYITKPFEPAVLRARLDAVLKQRERLRTHFANSRPAAANESSALTDGDFASHVLTAIHNSLDDSTYSVERLADEMAMSVSQLRRRTKDAFNMGPNALLRSERLSRAAQFLKDGLGNVSEIACACGFNSIHYFSRAYRSHFGVSPSAHIRKTANK